MTSAAFWPLAVWFERAPCVAPCQRVDVCHGSCRRDLRIDVSARRRHEEMTMSMALARAAHDTVQSHQCTQTDAVHVHVASGVALDFTSPFPSTRRAPVAFVIPVSCSTLLARLRIHVDLCWSFLGLAAKLM